MYSRLKKTGRLGGVPTAIMIMTNWRRARDCHTAHDRVGHTYRVNERLHLVCAHNNELKRREEALIKWYAHHIPLLRHNYGEQIFFFAWTRIECGAERRYATVS